MHVSHELSVIRKFKKNSFRGDATITANSIEIVYKIIQLTGKEFLGRPLEINILPSNSKQLKPFNKLNNGALSTSAGINKSFSNKNKIISTFVPLEREKKTNPFGQAKPVDTLRKDLEFEAQFFGTRNEKLINLAEIDPSIVSFKVKSDTKLINETRRTNSGYESTILSYFR